MLDGTLLYPSSLFIYRCETQFLCHGLAPIHFPCLSSSLFFPFCMSSLLPFVMIPAHSFEIAKCKLVLAFSPLLARPSLPCCFFVIVVGHLRGARPSGDELERKSCLKATVDVSLYHFSKQICRGGGGTAIRMPCLSKWKDRRGSSGQRVSFNNIATV